jgi:deoxyribodipyrimidine photo-lyase
MTDTYQPQNGPVQLVWFKRDLRVHDHQVLTYSAQQGPVLPLFVVEPEYWRQSDASARQWMFARECLQDLRHQLHALGMPLIVRVGEVADLFERINRSIGIAALWSHEETGNAWTYTRDQQVAAWCSENGIRWHQSQQHGTQRKLNTRNGWAKAWDAQMATPVSIPPKLTPIAGIPVGDIPTVADLGMGADTCPERQLGGRTRGLENLNTFLNERGQFYRSAMSNPIAGATACSRLSPYLAWGALSMREVAQANWAKQRDLKGMTSGSTGSWRGTLSSFSGRLHWHCHFIQKLEDDPRLEFRNMHPAYDGMRQAEPDLARLQAWQSGETGLPFVDACMRSLAATGWLNFRMRAMVTAVSSYHLWLDWRKPGEHLAQQFTDYEPGIHWPQIQMQSGTTGINTARIYNPIKQGYDQDPTGVFVRRWVPELAQIEDRFIHEPWNAHNAEDVLGKHYPFPIVDYLEAAKEARQKIYAVRNSNGFKDRAGVIVTKHGSRKGRVMKRVGRKKSKPETDQLAFTFDWGTQ